MFDPLTLAMIAAAKWYASRQSSRQTYIYCRMCSGQITGDYHVTNCCHTKLCPSCIRGWAQAGGKQCIYCGRYHS